MESARSAARDPRFLRISGKLPIKGHLMKLTLPGVLLLASITFGQIPGHPAAGALSRIFPAGGTPAKFAATKLSRADYLRLMAGNVDFFKRHQNAAGAIIDPYEKAEKQYSTPAFALAAALLVTANDRDDLLDPATRALTFSIHALANKTTADNHADFYIPMVIHARRLLQARVDKATAADWTEKLTGLIPEKTYKDVTAGGNWNLVNVAGEFLRREDNLVPSAQERAQSDYLDRCMAIQASRFTPWGMYVDPNAPLAYDIFPRLWLDDAFSKHRYHSKRELMHDAVLQTGGLSTLLLLSPTGEWPCGGRSAHHQWNEAAVAVVCEIEASRWLEEKRPDIASSFKRAAHLALASLQRWQRPSGELQIVKNHADPAQRFGYEGYSFHSQYNLLPIAMLALAYIHADDGIPESRIPSESASYVLDLREKFHKIVAASGGYYVEIDTAADPHYNATGLQRIHRFGAAWSPLSDSSAAQRNFGPSTIKARKAIAPGLESTASASSTAFKVLASNNSAIAFEIRYGEVAEEYALSGGGLDVVIRRPTGRFIFPLLMNDGDKDVPHDFGGGWLNCGPLRMLLMPHLPLKLDAEKYATHNGIVQMLYADIPPNTPELRYHLDLTAQP
jgi:hypothetical protein